VVLKSVAEMRKQLLVMPRCTQILQTTPCIHICIFFPTKPSPFAPPHPFLSLTTWGLFLGVHIAEHLSWQLGEHLRRRQRGAN